MRVLYDRLSSLSALNRDSFDARMAVVDRLESLSDVL